MCAFETPRYRDGSQSGEIMCLYLYCTGYGLEVDMWAAGVILYILLCGFPPFRSPERDQDELFNIIQLGHFEFLAPYWDNISDGETWGFPGRREGDGEMEPLRGSGRMCKTPLREPTMVPGLSASCASSFISC